VAGRKKLVRNAHSTKGKNGWWGTWPEMMCGFELGSCVRGLFFMFLRSRTRDSNDTYRASKSSSYHTPAWFSDSDRNEVLVHTTKTQTKSTPASPQSHHLNTIKCFQKQTHIIRRKMPKRRTISLLSSMTLLASSLRPPGSNSHCAVHENQRRLFLPWISLGLETSKKNDSI
jgi:hypothetical protein